MKLSILTFVLVICAGSIASVAQTKKKATSKAGDEKAASKTTQDIKHPNVLGTKTDRQVVGQEAERTRNGQAQGDRPNIKGTGEGSGPGSDAGVGLNSGIGDSDASSSGSGAVRTSEGASDGTNTRPRATLNIAGSPLPSNAMHKKKIAGQDNSANKVKNTSGKKAEEKKPARKKRNRG